MLPGNLSKAALLMLILVLAAITGWEFYLRKTGVTISYDNLEPLWADKRAMVYEPADKAVVFVGSSRIKFDLDVLTWEAITGTHAIQLAYEGSNPVPVLLNLAADEKFKGNLVVDVTEGLFFTPLQGPTSDKPNTAIKYFNEITPAQKAGFAINKLLESQFVFLDKDDYSLSAMLDKMQIPSRPGVMMLPYFPVEFKKVQFNRQSYMTDKMLADTNIQKKVTDIWTLYAQMGSHFPIPGGDTLLHIIAGVKMATDKIKARGGKVLFVRTPSSGPYWMGEQHVFPREKFWDKVLAITGCPGVHFNDYPAINHFICPEWSHLSPADAILFTKEFARILQQEKKWLPPTTATR